MKLLRHMNFATREAYEIVIRVHNGAIALEIAGLMHDL
jgi:hypothetical protein